MKNKELPFPLQTASPLHGSDEYAEMAVSSPSRRRKTVPKRQRSLAPLSSSGRGLLVSKGGTGEGKKKVRGG